MNCPIEYDNDVERRLAHPLLLPKYESDKGVVSLETNTMEKAVVNCGVEIHNATLRKGSDSSMYQRAGKQLEQRRSVLGYRSGYNNGHTSVSQHTPSLFQLLPSSLVHRTITTLT